MSKKKPKANKSPERISIFGVWYRAVNNETNEILAESSNLKEIVQLTKGENVRYLQKITLKTELPWNEMKKKDIPKVEALDE